tara:strand:- start:175 stop:918 length:744 start_codon:yes stop_codon:yes gene_type:complete
MLDIKFDTTKFTRKLRGIQISAIPEAQKKSLYKFGFLNKKKLRQEMISGSGKFINPVPLTLASPLYKVVDENSMVFFIRSNLPKGNKPSKYLAPVEYITGGVNQSYETRFSYWLRNYSGLPALSNKYAIPAMKSSAVQKNQYGNMKASQYSAVKSGLERFATGAKKAKGNQYRYFSIPAKGKPAKGFNKQGIYRVKGNTVGLLFTLSTKKPKVTQKFKFVGLTEKFVKKDMPYIFKSELRKQLAQFK